MYSSLGSSLGWQVSCDVPRVVARVLLVLATVDVELQRCSIRSKHFQTREKRWSVVNKAAES